MSNNPTLLNTPDAAQFLDLRPGTLEVWRTYGKGPKFVKIGRAVKYRLQDLEDYLDQAVRSSTSEYHVKRG